MPKRNRTITEARQRVTLDAFRRGRDPEPWTRYVFVLADELGDVGEAERRVLQAMARGEEAPVYAQALRASTSREGEQERRKPKR